MAEELSARGLMERFLNAQIEYGRVHGKLANICKFGKGTFDQLMPNPGEFFYVAPEDRHKGVGKFAGAEFFEDPAMQPHSFELLEGVIIYG